MHKAHCSPTGRRKNVVKIFDLNLGIFMVSGPNETMEPHFIVWLVYMQLNRGIVYVHVETEHSTDKIEMVENYIHLYFEKNGHISHPSN